MNEKMRRLGQKLREWWKKATVEDDKCMRCGCCSNLCKLVGLNEQKKDKQKGD